MKNDIAEQAILLWEEGELLVTNVENQSALYKMKEQYYVISYTSNNMLSKVEKVDLEIVNKLFGNTWMDPVPPVFYLDSLPENDGK